MSDPAAPRERMAPPPRWWLTLKEALVVLPLLGLTGTLYGVWSGWLRSGAAEEADSRYAAKHQVEFEASTERFKTDILARLAATDQDRDTRTLTAAQRVDTMQQAVIGRIQELQAEIVKRSEQRTQQINELSQRMAALELRVCVMANNKVSQCK